MSSTHVKVLKRVRIADGTHYGQEYAPGDTAEISTDLVEGLAAEGYVEVAKKAAKGAKDDTGGDESKAGGKGK